MSWSGSNSELLLPPPPPPPPPPPQPSSNEPDAPSDGDDDDIIMPNPNNWFFDKERLENTPSRKLGIDADRELTYRQQSANFIQDMGQRLQVNQLCINTAIVYMHRFYMYHSFSMFSRNNVSTASIFLAAKVEEQPRKLEYVIKVAHYCLHRESIPTIDIKSEAYTTQCTDLVNTENILLQTLGFDVGIDHPHTHVVKCCQLVRASKDLAQTSYFMATNSLHLTTMCMQYKPSVVACVCIHLACKWSNWEIPRSKEGRDWYWYVDDSVTAEQLEALTTEFLTIFNKSPSRLKKKIISLSAATSGSGGMNMSNFPSHFNFDAFNKQTPNSVGSAPGASKPRMLPPYSKSGQQPVPPPPPSISGGIPPLLGRPMRPPSVPTRELPSLLPPHMAGPLKPPPIHGQPPQGSSANKHNMQHSSTARPIPVHHSGSSLHPSAGVPRDGVPRDGVPRDGVPRDGVPREGVPRDGVPRDGVPRDGVPRDGVPRDGVPRDGSHVSRMPHPPPPPPISHHASSHQPYPPHHGARPAQHSLPVSSAGSGVIGGSSHTSNSQSLFGQSHAPGQKPQSQSGQMGHPMSSQQRQPPSSGQPLRPLLPPGSLSMKQSHGSGPMGGNKIPGMPPQQQQQQPLMGASHSGQVKRPYTEMARPDNRMEMNPSNNMKRECLPGDIRRGNAPPMPQAAPAPTKAQLQSLATQARAREKTEKMNAVQMAMLKKPHDNLTWAGSNKQQQQQQSVPELPPHVLQRPDSSHYLPPAPPPPILSANSSHSSFKMDYHQNVHGGPATSQPVVPKHEFPSAVSHSATSNHGNNSVSNANTYSNSSIPKNDFAYPFRPLSPINTKNEYGNAQPPPTNNLPTTVNVKAEILHNAKESRKNHNEINSGPMHGINVKSEPQTTGPPQLLPAPSVPFLGMGSLNTHRSDFTISLPLKNIPKKDPQLQQQQQQQQTAPPINELMLSMPKLEPAPVLNTLNLTPALDDSIQFTHIDSGFVNFTDFESQEAESEVSSGSKKKKKKKEHKKDRHRDKEEKKHKEKGEKKHRGDEEKKKHRDKEVKLPVTEEKDKKHKDKEEGRKHKKDKHKDKSSREKHSKSSKDKHASVPMITPQDDPMASSKIKIVFGRSGGDNSNNHGGKSSKKQHPTMSVLRYE